MSLSALMLAGALLGFYVVERVFRSAWRRSGGVTWAAALPGLMVVAVAAATGRTDIALGVAVSSAVAAIGLAGGITLLQRRADGPAPYDAGSWGLLVPGSLVLMLVGLSGDLGPGRAIVLAVVGLLVLRAIPAPGHTGDPETGPPIGPRWRRNVESLLALGVAGIAGWAGVEGTVILASTHPHASAGVLAACVLGPATVMPLLGLSASRAIDGDVYGGLSLCVRHATVSALLATALAGIVHSVASVLGEDPATTTRPLTEGLPSMSFPATLWRVETVLLLAMGVLLLPVGTGRIVPKRRDGAVLLGIYVLYLMLSSLSGLR